MAVQFILGPAGSGKTTYIMEQIAGQLQREPRKKIIIMVPEQASFCYQSALISQHPLAGVLTLEVLSFQRLARVMMQQHGGLARAHIDELGKLLMLRRLLQEHSAQYPYLGSSVDRAGYLAKLGQLIQEMKRYRIGSQQLEELLTQQQLPQSLFASKLQEISSLYSQYEAALSQDYLDSEDVLTVLEQQLAQTALLEQTDIWIDEFYDFTPQEYAILGLLMERAANVYLAMPANCSSGDISRKSAFHGTAKTLARLRQLVTEHGVRQLPDLWMAQPVRWQPQSPLYFLEQQYFQLRPAVWAGVPQQLALVEGQNRLSEVDAVARTIRQLCREQGYHYNEIGIFTRGDQYALLLETVLTDYDIPYFVDHKETISQHPLTELLLSVLDIMTGHWSYQSMFRFLKTELLPFAQQDIDLLENYVLQFGIRGSSWYQQQDWPYGAELYDLEQINHLRRRISQPLRQLQLALEDSQTIDQYIRQLYGLLEHFHVAAHLEDLCHRALEADLLETVQVHQQVWNQMVAIFDQMSHLLAEQTITLESCATLLAAAFENLDLGLLPNGLDQVFVGALAHSRSLGLRAVFVLGLNEGVFPARASQDGFFQDYEKQLLVQMGIQLSPESTEQLYEEQFLVYLALTRGSQYLSLSYALCDDEGKALRPSAVIGRVRTLFPQLEVTGVQWPPEDVPELLPYLSHPTKAVGLLGSQFVRPQHETQQELWAELYNWFLGHPSPLFEHVCHSMHHGTQLQQKTIQHTALFGRQLRLSVSALEQYRRCPYSYYLRYGLQLKDRMLYQMEAVDVGQFYHSAVEQFSSHLLEQGLSWDLLSKEQVVQMMNSIVDEMAPSIQNAILLSSGRYRYLQHRFRKTLERTALFLLEHGQKGDFVPVALEADFGGKDSRLPTWRMQLQDGTSMVLQGRIDRIEAATQGDRHYLRIIDFKSGTQGLKLMDIYYGLKIQLLTYLQVAYQHYETLLGEEAQLIPAGVLYYFFRSGILSTEGPLSADEAQQMHMTKLRADGLLLADLLALQLAERDLSTGSSRLLPVSLLKSAEPYLNGTASFSQLEDPMSIFSKTGNHVVTQEQLGWLLGHVQQLILQLGEAIHRGNIAIRPCRVREFVGCQYCDYQTICQIQTVNLEQAVEELQPLQQEEIWQRLQQEQGAANQKGGAEQ